MKEIFDYFPMVEQWDSKHTKTLLALFVAKVRYPSVGKTGFCRAFNDHVFSGDMVFVGPLTTAAGEITIYPKLGSPITIKSTTSFIELTNKPKPSDAACIYIPNRVKVVEHPPIGDRFYRLLDKYADEAREYYLETIKQIPPVSDYV